MSGIQLSAERQQAARQYIAQHGRGLERALLAHFMDGASAEAALAALSTYQNADGGFGNAIEPDIRCAPSSPIGTTVAVQLLRDMGVPGEHPLVRGAIGYFLHSYAAERERWDFNTPAMNSAPHAPWWAFDDTQPLPTGFDSNPSAQIVGHLWHYADLVPADFLEMVTRQMMAYLETMPATIHHNDMMCWLWAESADNLPDPHRQRLRDKLFAIVDHVVVRDPAEWGNYVAKPLDLAPFPDSLLAPALADDLDVNLDYEIAEQGDDGAWAPSWSWFGNFPDMWPVAEREWKGVLTLNVLRSLKAYGRLTE